MSILRALDKATQASSRGEPSKNSMAASEEAGPSRLRQSPSSVAREREASSAIDTWTLKELQAEARKFGFRVTDDRGIVKAQVEAAHRALEEKRRAKDDDRQPSSSQSHSSALMLDEGDDTLGAITVMSDDDDDAADALETEVGDLTAALIAEAKERRTYKGQIVSSGGRDEEGASNIAEHSGGTRSDDDDDDDSGVAASASSSQYDAESGGESQSQHRQTAKRSQAPEPSMGRVPADVAKQLYEAVKADKDLYSRILLYEPVSFDEVNSTAKRAGVTGLRSKETLRNWLDVQCICFYSAELTGQRQRY